MDMRRTGKMVFVASALLIMLLALGAFAQTDSSISESQVSATTTTGTATAPAACPPGGTAMGTSGAMTSQATAMTSTSAMAEPSMMGYAGLWRATGPMERIHGHVASVDEYYPYPGSAPGLQVMLRVTPGGEEGTPDWQLSEQPPYRIVQFGPEWYVRENLGRIRIGEPMVVTGAPALWRGHKVFLAERVQTTGHRLVLRNDVGMPMWAGGWSGWGTPTGMASATGIGLYDPNTVQTVSGRLDRVWSGVPVAGLDRMRMIAIRRSDNSVLNVALAPDSYIGQSNIPLTVGDSVTVTGSLVSAEGRPLLIASQLQEGNQQLTLRDSTGNPAWAVAMAGPSTVASAEATGPSASASATIGQPASGVPYGSSNQPNTGAAMPGNQANAGAEAY